MTATHVHDNLDTVTHHPKYGYALWYAWGQQDAGIGRHVSVETFAHEYAEAALALTAGRGSYLSSIQDAWKRFVAGAS